MGFLWNRASKGNLIIPGVTGSEPVLFDADRGFTGHEYFPWFKMINMNGRIYDPLTGQFLSPVNNVQLPDFIQNYNRYGYCLQNT